MVLPFHFYILKFIFFANFVFAELYSLVTVVTYMTIMFIYIGARGGGSHDYRPPPRAPLALPMVGALSGCGIKLFENDYDVRGYFL